MALDDKSTVMELLGVDLIPSQEQSEYLGRVEKNILDCRIDEANHYVILEIDPRLFVESREDSEQMFPGIAYRLRNFTLRDWTIKSGIYALELPGFSGGFVAGGATVLKNGEYHSHSTGNPQANSYEGEVVFAGVEKTTSRDSAREFIELVRDEYAPSSI